MGRRHGSLILTRVGQVTWFWGVVVADQQYDRQSQSQPSVAAYELHGNCYVNLTNRCTLRCAFCPKFQKSWDVQGYALRLRAEPTVDELLSAVGDPRRYREIVFCGLGEPTMRLPELLQVAKHLKHDGAHCIRINTDGLASLVHGRDVVPALFDRVDALSVSLNAQDEATYERHCRPQLPGSYEAMLEFIRRARLFVPSVTATAIDGLPGVDMNACRLLARRLGVGFRRRVLDQVG